MFITLMTSYVKSREIRSFPMHIYYAYALIISKEKKINSFTAM